MAHGVIMAQVRSVSDMIFAPKGGFRLANHLLATPKHPVTALYAWEAMPLHEFAASVLISQFSLH